MSLERVLEAAVVAIIAMLLVIYVPRTRLREALVVFFFKEFMTWPLGLTVVHYGLI